MQSNLLPLPLARTILSRLNIGALGGKVFHTHKILLLLFINKKVRGQKEYEEILGLKAKHSFLKVSFNYVV